MTHGSSWLRWSGACCAGNGWRCVGHIAILIRVIAAWLATGNAEWVPPTWHVIPVDALRALPHASPVLPRTGIAAEERVPPPPPDRCLWSLYQC